MKIKTVLYLINFKMGDRKKNEIRENTVFVWL